MAVALDCGYLADTSSLGPYPPTSEQIEALAQFVAVVANVLCIPIDKNHVLTHGEAANNEDGLRPHPCYAWWNDEEGDGDTRGDLEYLGTSESPSYNPLATDGSRGGDVIRGKANWYQNQGYDVDYKNVLLVSVLALCFSAPVTGWAEEPTYTVTETQLTQLESIFQQLKTQQQQQAQQIKTLKTQLTASENQIRQSQTSLQKANQSLQESAEEAKRTHDRLERQRDTWAAAAVLILAGVTFTEKDSLTAILFCMHGRGKISKEYSGKSWEI